MELSFKKQLTKLDTRCGLFRFFCQCSYCETKNYIQTKNRQIIDLYLRK